LTPFDLTGSTPSRCSERASRDARLASPSPGSPSGGCWRQPILRVRPGSP